MQILELQKQAPNIWHRTIMPGCALKVLTFTSQYKNVIPYKPLKKFPIQHWRDPINKMNRIITLLRGCTRNKYLNFVKDYSTWTFKDTFNMLRIRNHFDLSLTYSWVELHHGKSFLIASYVFPVDTYSNQAK